MRIPATPGWASSTWRSRWARTLSCSVQPREGSSVEVDLGQDAVEEQILELLFVADVVVEGAGDDPQAGGQAAHGQGLGAVVGDDRQRLVDDAFAGELGAAVLVVDGRAEPQRG